MNKVGRAEKETSSHCDRACTAAFWTEIFLAIFNRKAEEATEITSQCLKQKKGDKKKELRAGVKNFITLRGWLDEELQTIGLRSKNLINFNICVHNNFH